MEWRSSLCMPSYECGMACCLPCVVIGQNVYEMHKRNMQTPMIDGPYQGTNACCLYAMCMAPAVLSPCVSNAGYLSFLQCGAICFHALVRNSIRQQKKIRNGCPCEDFWCALCCYSCAMAQEHREIIFVTNNTMVIPNGMGN